MARPKQNKINQRGLSSNFNHLTLPGGELIEAKNLDFTSDGAIKPRRGFVEETDIDSSTNLQAATEYKGSIVTIKTDGDVEWEGQADKGITTETITADYDNGYGVIRFAQMNGNLYYNTDDGVKRIDAVNGSPEFAGFKDKFPPFHDRYFNLQTYPKTTSSGAPLWLPDGKFVSYKSVFGIRDANDNVHLSIPSGKGLLENDSGGARAGEVVINFSGLSTDHFLQLYRTFTFDTSETGADYYLVAEVQLTSTDISNGYVEFTDYVPETLLGTILYTSSGAEGDISANRPPPISKDLAPFAGHMFYAAAKDNDILESTIGAVRVSDGDVGLRIASEVGDATDTSDTITNMTDTSDIEVGMLLAADTAAFPLGAEVVSKTSSSVTLDTPATASYTAVTHYFGDGTTIDGETFICRPFISFPPGLPTYEISTGGTAEDNIRNARQSFVSAVNQHMSGQGKEIYARALDITPGSFVLIRQGTSFGDSVFSVSSTNDQAYIPEMSAIGTSTPDDRQHVLWYSKFQQPEAVPLDHTIPIGSRNFPILRLAVLQNSLIIFKEDGVYQLTGVSADSFRVRVLDPTLQLTHFNSVAVVHNRAYALTDRGVISVGENDIRFESNSIWQELYDVTSGFQKPTSNAHLWAGHGLDDAGQYILQLNDASKTCYCLDVIRRVWTKWDFAMADEMAYSFQSPSDGRLYFFADSADKLWRQDTQNKYDASVFVAAGTVSTFDYDNNFIEVLKSVNPFDLVTPAVGDLVEITTGAGGEFYVSNVESVDSDTKWRLTFEDDITASNFDNNDEWTYYSSVETLVGWSPWTGSSLSGYKHFDKLAFTFRSNSVDDCNVFYSTDIDGQDTFESQLDSQDSSVVPTYTTNITRTPSGEDAVDTFSAGIPRGARRSTRLRTAFHTRRANTTYVLEGVECTFTEPSEKDNRRLQP